MNPLAPWPALAAVLLLLACGAALSRLTPGDNTQGRHASIDGLRGFLAFGVFLHHSAAWYYYLRTGAWVGYDSHLYRHCGESAVALFFMITAFLFTARLLDARIALDWRRLYVNRLWRLAPLYLFAMLLLSALVAIESGFVLREPPALLLRSGLVWLLFSIGGQPDLNGLADTTQRLAGVTWSLPYEWFFYLLLPTIALLLGRRPAWPVLIASAVLAALVASGQHNRLAYESFTGGIAAAVIVREPRWRERLSGTAGSALAAGCIVLAVVISPSGYSRPSLPLMSIAFIAIACGSSLFGLLRLPAARSLGEISYSLYLLHGALLTILFRHVLGLERARLLEPLQHWLLILACVPVLVLVCALSHRCIEQPGIAMGRRREPAGLA